MEHVKIHCTCGEIYYTTVYSYSKTFNPPILYEQAERACPKCNLLYTKEDQPKSDSIRTIDLTNKKD